MTAAAAAAVEAKLAHITAHHSRLSPGAGAAFAAAAAAAPAVRVLLQQMQYVSMRGQVKQ
jgi:hypothetical protein